MPLLPWDGRSFAMIVTINGGALQEPLNLTEEEQSILNDKKNSSVVYNYNSPQAVAFEMKTRANIVAAARGLNSSGAKFATFANTKGNSQYWTRTDKGALQLRPGVSPSAAIQDIFNQGSLYAFECATATVIILYKAVLDTVGAEIFNRNFAQLELYDWDYDQDLKLVSSNQIQEAYPGDVLYFKNPDVDPKTPQWQGENTILLGPDQYFGHGIGIATSQQIINALNSHRRQGSTTEAYLMNDVVHPDFEYLRSLR